MFDSTNMYRSWHQAPPLTWSVTLAAAAQSYALQLASQKCALIHSGAGPENLMSTLRYPKPDASWCVVGSVHRPSPTGFARPLLTLSPPTLTSIPSV